MTNKGQMYMFSGDNIKDFRQLLKSLYTHLAYEHKKANKKLNSLSVIFDDIYIYIYMFCFFSHTVCEILSESKHRRKGSSPYLAELYNRAENRQNYQPWKGN